MSSDLDSKMFSIEEVFVFDITSHYVLTLDVIITKTRKKDVNNFSLKNPLNFLSRNSSLLTVFGGDDMVACLVWTKGIRRGHFEFR